MCERVRIGDLEVLETGGSSTEGSGEAVKASRSRSVSGFESVSLLGAR